MNKTVPVLSILACLVLQACIPTHAPAAQLPLQKQPLSEGQAVFIDVDNGSLEISSGESGLVEVSGQAPSLEDQAFRMMPGADGIHIVSKKQSHAFWQPAPALLHLKLSVPHGVSVNINSFDAGIDIHDFSGTVNLTSVSGEIAIRDSSGKLVIKSNRGNVTIQSTSGELHVAGNYGLLTIVNTRGKLDASTIMGTLQFAGQVAAGDNLTLETDHGPIEIQLAQASDAAVQIGTTTGVVTCTMPGLHYDGQGCTGTLQGGQGRLKVRTVSGSVTLEQLP